MGTRIDLGSVVLRLDDYTVDGPDGAVRLSALEVAVLRALIGATGAVSQEALLRSVWNYRPGVETKAPLRLVARLRTKLGPAAAHLVTIKGVGFRWDGPRLAPDAAPALGPLVGRDAAVARLSAWFNDADPTPITVVGPPGVGKSRLLREVTSGRQGVVWVDLSGRSDPAAVLAERLVASELPATVTLDRLAGVLRAATWLVLDGPEADALGARELVAGLGVRCPRLRIAVGARHRVGVAHERVLELAPLDPPDARALLLHQLRGTGWTDVPEGALEALLARLGGLPLAIELAGAQVNLAGWPRVEDGGRLPLVDDPSAPLQEVITWAIEPFDANVQRVFTVLGAFAGPVTVEGLAEVAGADVGSAVDRLCAHSLATLQDGEVGLLEPIRQAARLRLPALADQRLVLTRHAVRVVREAEAIRAERNRRGGDRLLAALAALVPDLERASAWCRATDAALATSAALCLHTVHLARGPIQRAVQVAEEALPLAVTPGQRVVLAEALLRALVQKGDVARAAALLTTIRLDDAPEALRAQLLRSAGLVRRMLGDLPGAERAWDEAVALARASGDRVELARCLTLRSVAATARSAHDDAESALVEALALAEREGGAALIGHVLTGLGALRLEQVRYAEAEGLYRRAEAIHAALGDRQGETLAVCQLSHVPLPVAELVPVLLRAIGLSSQVGDTRFVVLARSRLAAIDAAHGRDIDDLSEGLEAVSALGDDATRALCELNLALAFALSSRFDEARTHWESAARRTNASNARRAGVALAMRMHLHALEGDPLRALEDWRLAVQKLGADSPHVTGELVEGELAWLRGAAGASDPVAARASAEACLARLRDTPRTDACEIRILEKLLQVS